MSNKRKLVFVAGFVSTSLLTFHILFPISLPSFVASNPPQTDEPDNKRAKEPTVLSADGAWSWFGDPRAVRYKSHTYVGYVTRNGDVTISAYNHETGTTASSSLRTDLQTDDHANPSILIRADGHIVVFYSKHSGSHMHYRISLKPEDISLWSEEFSIPTNTAGAFGYTYPNPVQLAGEDDTLYLFWRGGNRNPTFSTTIDLSVWTPARTLILAPSSRPYVKYVSDDATKIHFAYTDSNPDEVHLNSVHYAYYEQGAFFKANGTLIRHISDLPLLINEGDLIFDSERDLIKSWVWDIALDTAGYPVIVYATFSNERDHRYRYARWNGERWTDTEITASGEDFEESGTEPYYSGGIALDHENPSVAYLSRSVDGTFEIEKWITHDNGVTWASSTVTTLSSTKNIRPIVPRGHVAGEMDVVWMSGEYDHFTDYNTALRFANILAPDEDR